MTKCTRCHAEIVPFDILKPRWRVLVQLPGGEIIPRPLCEKCQMALCEWVLHEEEESNELLSANAEHGEQRWD